MNSTDTILPALFTDWIFKWPVWFRGLSLKRKLWPIIFVFAYWFLLYLLHGFRSDHFTMGLMILALGYSGKPFEPVFRFLQPFLFTAIFYDSMRFWSDYVRGPIHVKEPYLFDRYFFGIHTAQGILTPNEYWQLHTAPILDLICGFFYLVFIFLYIATAAYFLLWLGRKGTAKMRGVKIAKIAWGMPWAFFWLNMLGYSTYYWFAAAPPWYVAAYGLGPARMDAHASSAGCVRFDQLLGTHFFSEMYGRAADIFGAVPSLHVSYPLLAVIFAFYFGGARIFAVLFYLIMCFSAVYLNHHYILDILWGSTYAVIVGLLTIRYFESKSRA